jgi:hypothetical protein
VKESDMEKADEKKKEQGRRGKLKLEEKENVKNKSKNIRPKSIHVEIF